MARTMPRVAFTLPPEENRCGSAGLVGSYKPVTLPDARAEAMAEAALGSYLRAADAGSGAAGCKPEGGVKVTSACAQVVQGTNWQLSFEAPLSSCSGADANKVAVLEAQVYEPLPYTTAAPEVTQVTASCVRPAGSVC